MEASETDLLVISTSYFRIRDFVQLGYNTVYLRSENNGSYDYVTLMPDEIWDEKDFYDFVDNPKVRKPYTSETIGFPDKHNDKTTLIKRPEDLEIEGTDHLVDVVFAGRYFIEQDNRHYNHPLSRAIIGLKQNSYNHSNVVKKGLAHTIDTYLAEDTTVHKIVFAPPRPNQKSRFIGVEDYTNTKINIKYDLLRSVTNYPSPKGYSDYEDKSKLLKGNIACEKEVSGHILLVDDVFTSGATMTECAKMLYKAGASKVTVLTLAYTQDCNFKGQSVTPAVFNSEGNEFRIAFDRKEFKAYWSSEQSGENTPEKKGYNEINEEYIKQHAIAGTKPVEKRYGPLKQVNAVIFDLDNTLIDTKHLNDYRKKWSAITDKSLLKQEHILIDPSVLEKLKKDGIKIGIVTKSPRKYAESILSAYNYPYDNLVAARETIKGKPAPDPLLKCAIKLKVNPDNILNVGDEDADIEAGEKAGMMNLQVGTINTEKILKNLNSPTTMK